MQRIASPIRFDGGRGFSRSNSHKANTPAQLLRSPHGAGIPHMPDFAPGTL
jgi:hypothetical protein